MKYNTAMRRKDREITDRNEIMNMLGTMDTVRIALNDPEGAYIVPLSFGYEERNGNLCLYMHSAPEGRKIDMIRASSAAGFELDRAEGLVEGDRACEYSMKYSSIIGRGRITLIEDMEEKLHGMLKIMEHYSGKYDWDIPQRAIENTVIIKLEVIDISAKKH